MASCRNHVPKLVALSLTKLKLKKLLLMNQKLSAAQNDNFKKSLILEPMQILRFGKRYCVHIGEIYKHTKFQIYGPNTRPQNTGQILEFYVSSLLWYIRYAVSSSLGRRALPRSHDNISRDENKIRLGQIFTDPFNSLLPSSKTHWKVSKTLGFRIMSTPLGFSHTP